MLHQETVVNPLETNDGPQNNFNFATWDNWAKTGSANPNVKVMRKSFWLEDQFRLYNIVGVPAGSTAAGSGYESASQLAGVIKYCATFSSFGGVMVRHPECLLVVFSTNSI